MWARVVFAVVLGITWMTAALCAAGARSCSFRSSDRQKVPATLARITVPSHRMDMDATLYRIAG
jgi:hypothetical protein